MILRVVSGRRDGIRRRLAGHVCLCTVRQRKNACLIGRDHLGIIPLYMGYDEHGQLYVASEMKALVPVCRTIKEFPAELSVKPGRRNPLLLSSRLVRLRCGER
ncbi:hypothetical protein ACNKHW_04065 [Shigella flexneri]